MHRDRRRGLGQGVVRFLAQAASSRSQRWCRLDSIDLARNKLHEGGTPCDGGGGRTNLSAMLQETVRAAQLQRKLQTISEPSSPSNRHGRRFAPHLPIRKGRAAHTKDHPCISASWCHLYAPIVRPERTGMISQVCIWENPSVPIAHSLQLARR